jgi:hypothetical protein
VARACFKTASSDGSPAHRSRTRRFCEATTLTEYQQRNNVARVTGTVSIEFNETWQRADGGDHTFNTDYPIARQRRAHERARAESEARVRRCRALSASGSTVPIRRHCAFLASEG